MRPGQVKYAVVREALLRRIEEMEPGDRLPPEPALCEEYDVSRITIRRAVEELIREGRLDRQQGRGTFVLDPDSVRSVPESFARSITGFYREQTQLGNAVTSRVLSQGIAANARVAERLGLPGHSELVEVERLRFVNGDLVMHNVTWLPAARFQQVVDFDYTQGSLFESLEERFAVRLIRNDLSVRIARAAPHVAQALGVAPEQPVLAMDSLVFGDGDLPVAFGTSHHASDRAEILVSVSRSGLKL